MLVLYGPYVSTWISSKTKLVEMLLLGKGSLDCLSFSQTTQVRLWLERDDKWKFDRFFILVKGKCHILLCHRLTLGGNGVGLDLEALLGELEYVLVILLLQLDFETRTSTETALEKAENELGLSGAVLSR